MRWICDRRLQSIVEKGRQEGFTWIEAFWSVSKRLRKKLDHYFVSADEDTAKQFIDDCKEWITRLNEVSAAAGGPPLVDIAKATTERIFFPNGSKIVALSSNPKALRGKRGDVTLDEYAFSERALDVMKAAVAVTTWGDGKEPGQLRVISTHDGVGTHFYELIQGAKAGKNGYSYHRVTIYDAVDDGIHLKIPGPHRKIEDRKKSGEAYIEYQRRRCSNEEIFQQEFNCQPLSAASLILPHEYNAVLKDMRDAEDKILPQWYISDQFNAGATYGDLFVGVDVGRAKALTAIWVAERAFDHLNNYAVYRTVSVTLIQGQDIQTQYATLKPILNHASMNRCAIDQGTIGRALYDLAAEEFGEMILPVQMTLPMKARCAETMKGMVQMRRMTLPEDVGIMNDILSLKRMISQTKQISYDGQSEIGHCDCAWAAGLMLFSAGETKPLFLAGDKKKEAA